MKLHLTPATKTFGLWLFLVISFVVFFNLFSENQKKYPFERFSDDLRDDEVLSVKVHPTADGAGAWLEVEARNQTSYKTMEMPLQPALNALASSGVAYSLERPTFAVTGMLLAQWVPIAVLILLMWLFFRQLKASTQKNPTLEESTNARLQVQSPPAVESAHAPDAPLLDAMRALKEGRDGPRKILLSGPPGSGKTSSVRQAVAASGLQWLPVLASDMPNVFVGLAAARVRRAFEIAAKTAPCVLLFEDLDAMASRRVLPGDGTATAEGQLTEAVNGMIELCQILDGVRPFPPGVLFVATTNRPDRLDEAIVRPGRFDLHIELPNRALSSSS